MKGKNAAESRRQERAQQSQQPVEAEMDFDQLRTEVEASNVAALQQYLQPGDADAAYEAGRDSAR